MAIIIMLPSITMIFLPAVLLVLIALLNFGANDFQKDFNENFYHFENKIFVDFKTLFCSLLFSLLFISNLHLSGDDYIV